MARKRRENPTCIVCGVALLIGENWKESLKKCYAYRCVKCNGPYTRARNAVYSKRPNALYSQLKHKATVKKGRPWVPFTITFDDFCALRRKPCHYCGGPLPPQGPGADQKVAGLGYTAENALPCCELCNNAKSDMLTYEQTVKFIGPAIRALRKECEENGTPAPSCASRFDRLRKRKQAPPT